MEARAVSASIDGTIKTKKDHEIVDGDGLEDLRPYETEVSVANCIPPRKTYLQRLAFAAPSSGGWALFFRHSYQPFVLLFTFPAISYCALMYGSLLAWFSVVVNLYSTYFNLPPYNFGPSGIGLLNLPPFIGGLLGSVCGGLLSDRMIVRLSKRNGGVFEPEMRLWLAFPGMVLLPGSLALFGLSMEAGLPWIVPCLGLGGFGFTFVMLGNVVLTYAMVSFWYNIKWFEERKLIHDSQDCYTEVRTNTDLIVHHLCPS